jgi:sugar phosphate isomerase/epimerase
MFRSSDNLTRRSALASLSLPILARGAPANSSKSPIQFGCQTNAWPIRPAESETLFSALASIRQLGFAGFETGFANILPLRDRPADFQNHIAGLTPFGVHIFLQHYDPATSIAPPELVADISSLGARMGFQRLILSGAPATDVAALKAKIGALNRYGKQVNDLGMTLAYHNHGPEFQGAHPEIESLLAETDPKLVWFLLDAGHAFAAGADVVSFVDSHSSRLTGLHLRDYRNANQVPLGEGGFPLAAVAKVLRQNHWSGWALAEEERLDGSKPGNAAAAPAIAALHKAFGV